MSDMGKKSYGRVWDPLVRLFHWVLVGAFATAWFERSEAAIHQTAGKTVLILIILRTAWGLIGPASARFDTFVKGPVTTLRYVFSIFRGKPEHYPGHNPAGAAMIGALLLSLVTTAASGVLMTTTAFWGGEWIEWIHGTAATLTVLLIAGHLLGVIAACLQHKENLPLSMVTGRKFVSVNTERFLGPFMFTKWRMLTAAAIVAAASAAWAGSSSFFNAGLWRMPKTIAAAAKAAGCDVAEVTGPRVVVYPSFQLQYEVGLNDAANAAVAAIPVFTALERRPKIDIADVAADCQTIVRSQFVENLGAPLIKFAELVTTVLPVPPASSALKAVADKPIAPEAASAAATPAQEASAAAGAIAGKALSTAGEAVRPAPAASASATPAPAEASSAATAAIAGTAPAATPPKLISTNKAPLKPTTRPTPSPTLGSPVPPKPKAENQRRVSKAAEAKVPKVKPRKKVVKKKPVRKIKASKTIRGNGSVVRRQYFDSYGRSGSGNSGSGSSNSGSGSGNSGSGSNNSGSGSSGSGSGNSGSGGGDDD